MEIFLLSLNPLKKRALFGQEVTTACCTLPGMVEKPGKMLLLQVHQNGICLTVSMLTPINLAVLMLPPPIINLVTILPTFIKRWIMAKPGQPLQKVSIIHIIPGPSEWIRQEKACYTLVLNGVCIFHLTMVIFGNLSN